MKQKLVQIIIGVVSLFLLLGVGQAKEYTMEQLPQLTQDPIHQTVSKRVTNYFTQAHYHHIQLDDAFSEKIFDRYFKLLDSNKGLFTADDIAQFEPQKTVFAQELKTGDLSVAFDIYNFALKKRFMRYQYALSVLAQPMNFDSDESIDFERDKMPWPTSEKELDEYWQKRVKFDELSLALTDKKEDEIREILSKRYRQVLKILIQTNSEDAFQVFMNAFAREIDPHTSYLAPRKKRDFDSEMSLSFEGIGATLNMEDDYTSIVSFVKGGPAEKSNQLAIGDKIIGVGQKGKQIQDVIGWRLDDIVDLIRGPKGTTVNLEILPAGANTKPKTIELKRDTIRFEDREVKSSIIQTPRGKVGVLEVPSFYIGLTNKTKTLLAEFNKENVDSVVIDLRNNGGGSLSEAIGLTGLFIESGPVVQVRDDRQNVIQYDNNDGFVYYNGPLVVLVNRYSASASEIFSAALQDYHRAAIVGETTFGKGTVQTSRNIAYPIDERIHPDWPSLGGVQYTIQKFYRINGGSTQLKGVVPDIEMTDMQLDYETGERFLDNALPWDSIKAARYSSFGNVDKILPKLNVLHEQRIKQDPEFNYIDADISRLNKESDKQFVISLNKAKRELEQDENDKRELTRTNERLERMHQKPVKSLDELPKDYKVPDAFLNEAAEIALDLKAGYKSNN
ncbi:carboxy terminal-processing peptidase [Utexia brackfieldae]|uniref:carboxy terminal-processing peptidase n=1 Tax=Utexia brackfieldae TaxID=3074108 RepID=UPI00370D38E3